MYTKLRKYTKQPSPKVNYLNKNESKEKKTEKYQKACYQVAKSFFEKYKLGDDAFNVKQINDIVYNEKANIVANFKDFLIYDDSSEFLKRFYKSKESEERLPRLYDYYENYSKIFPNYIILPEAKFIYKNIQKKQRLIDTQQMLEANELNRKSDDSSSYLFDTKIHESIMNISASFTQPNEKLNGIKILNTNNLGEVIDLSLLKEQENSFEVLIEKLDLIEKEAVIKTDIQAKDKMNQEKKILNNMNTIVHTDYSYNRFSNNNKNFKQGNGTSQQSQNNNNNNIVYVNQASKIVTGIGSNSTSKKLDSKEGKLSSGVYDKKGISNFNNNVNQNKQKRSQNSNSNNVETPQTLSNNTSNINPLISNNINSSISNQVNTFNQLKNTKLGTTGFKNSPVVLGNSIQTTSNNLTPSDIKSRGIYENKIVQAKTKTTSQSQNFNYHSSASSNALGSDYIRISGGMSSNMATASTGTLNNQIEKEKNILKNNNNKLINPQTSSNSHYNRNNPNKHSIEYNLNYANSNTLQNNTITSKNNKFIQTSKNSTLKNTIETTVDIGSITGTGNYSTLINNWNKLSVLKQGAINDIDGDINNTGNAVFQTKHLKSSSMTSSIKNPNHLNTNNYSENFNQKNLSNINKNNQSTNLNIPLTTSNKTTNLIDLKYPAKSEVGKESMNKNLLKKENSKEETEKNDKTYVYSTKHFSSHTKTNSMPSTSSTGISGIQQQGGNIYYIINQNDKGNTHINFFQDSGGLKILNNNEISSNRSNIINMKNSNTIQINNTNNSKNFIINSTSGAKNEIGAINNNDTKLILSQESLINDNNLQERKDSFNLNITKNHSMNANNNQNILNSYNNHLVSGSNGVTGGINYNNTIESSSNSNLQHISTHNNIDLVNLSGSSSNNNVNKNLAINNSKSNSLNNSKGGVNVHNNKLYINALTSGSGNNSNNNISNSNNNILTSHNKEKNNFRSSMNKDSLKKQQETCNNNQNNNSQTNNQQSNYINPKYNSIYNKNNFNTNSQNNHIGNIKSQQNKKIIQDNNNSNNNYVYSNILNNSNSNFAPNQNNYIHSRKNSAGNSQQNSINRIGSSDYNNNNSLYNVNNPNNLLSSSQQNLQLNQIKNKVFSSGTIGNLASDSNDVNLIYSSSKNDNKGYITSKHKTIETVSSTNIMSTPSSGGIINIENNTFSNSSITNLENKARFKLKSAVTTSTGITVTPSNSNSNNRNIKSNNINNIIFNQSKDYLTKEKLQKESEFGANSSEGLCISNNQTPNTYSKHSNTKSAFYGSSHKQFDNISSFHTNQVNSINSINTINTLNKINHMKISGNSGQIGSINSSNNLGGNNTGGLVSGVSLNIGGTVSNSKNIFTRKIGTHSTNFNNRNNVEKLTVIGGTITSSNIGGNNTTNSNNFFNLNSQVQGNHTSNFKQIPQNSLGLSSSITSSGGMGTTIKTNDNNSHLSDIMKKYNQIGGGGSSSIKSQMTNQTNLNQNVLSPNTKVNLENNGKDIKKFYIKSKINK